MDVFNILNTLESHQISLALDGEDLEVNFSQETIPDEVIALLREHKPLLVNYLKDMKATPAFQRIAQASPADSYPLSSAQRRLWLLSQVDEVSLVYNLPFSFRMQGDYDLEVLEKAIYALVERHESLRTVFREDAEGDVRQWILPMDTFDFKVQIRDLSGVPEAQTEIENFIAADSRVPFDLERGPLLRVVFFKKGPSDFLCYYNMHHIISDGWSMNVLVRDVIAFYRAIAGQSVPELADLRIQYKDYAVWQNDQLNAGAYAAHQRFWMDKFAGELPALTLPSKFQRPALRSSRGRLLGTYLDQETTTLIRTYLKSRGGSMFMFLLAAVKTLFHRYTGEEDLILGSPVAGREHAELEDQIGCYINTLAIRSAPEGGITFDAFFQQLKQDLLEIYTHQAYPFDRLVNDLGLGRDASRSPLFDVMVALQNTEQYDSAERVSEIYLGGKTHDRPALAKFDMEFTFVEVGDRIGMGLNYNTEVYDYESVVKLIEHFQRLVRKIAADGSLTLDQYDFLSAAERQIVLEGFNDTDITYPAGLTVVDLFYRQAHHSPDRIAVTYESTRLTYRELDALTNRLAHYLLQAHAIQADDLISIKQERSHWMVISILGILKSGAAYVPIDPGYPADRIEFVEQDSRCKLCLDEAFVEEFEAKLQAYPDTRPAVQPQGKNLAYAIYTSGSTGKPKGVINSHAGLYNRLLWMRDDLEIVAEDVILQKTPYMFDVSVWELLMLSCTGSELVFAKPEGHKEARYLQSIIQGAQVTVMHFVPSMLRVFLDDLEPETCRSLRHVVCSGEALPNDLVLTFKELLPWVRLHNLYGPTEAAIDVTSIDLTEVDTRESGVTIGKPVANTRMYIVDKNMAPQPIGVPGELLIEGVQVAEGYLNRPELNAEKFIASPFRPGERIYRTGDLAKWLPNGEIFYLGRIDHQVKLRGNRIELGEIEQVLSKASAAVTQVVVDVVEHNKHQSLVAFYTAKSEVDQEQLRAALEEKLPEYMVPAFFLALETMPLTPNGKVNRKALKAYEFERTNAANYVAPSNKTEEQLAAIWEEVLGLEQVGVQDDFFEIGGNSLLTQQVLNKIYKQLKGTLSYREFFQAPTIEAISKKLKSGAYTEIPKAPEQASYPLTAAQQQIWVLSQLEGGSAAYNIPGLARLKGTVHLDALQQAYRLLLERHEVFRTAFRTDDTGRTRQYVQTLGPDQTRILIRDFSDRTEAELDEYLKREYTTAFDLTKAPLIRTLLIKTGPDSYIFTFILHHLIGDGWSMELLVKEFVYFYNQLLKGEAAALPELPLQYKDYALWAEAQIGTQAYQASEAYWLSTFAGEIPVLELPGFKQRPPVQTYNGRTVRHLYAPELLEKLEAFSLQHKVSLFMTLMAGMNALLHRYTGQNDFVLGTPIAGREHPDLEEQIGLYLNTLAIRTQVDAEETFGDLLERQKQLLLEAYEHQAYPFDKLVSKVHLNRDPARSPLFDVMVVFLNHSKVRTIRSAEVLQEVEAMPYVVEGKTAQFDMSFVFEVADTLELSIEYNTDIYDERIVQGLFRHFELLLHAAMTETAAPIKALDYLSAEEKELLVLEFNQTERAFPRNETLITRFEAQAALAAGRAAVLTPDRSLDYATLNAEANRLAWYLRSEYGLRANDLVALKLPRNEQLLIALLGILKAGAAYVPIDPEYPEGRIAFMEADSRCRLLLDEEAWQRFTAHKDRYETSDPPAVNRPEDLAYVIYTSGSTGRPKGVKIAHYNVLNLISEQSQYFKIDQSDAFLLFYSVSFDASVEQIFLALLNGCSLYVAPKEVLLDKSRFYEALQQHRITHLDAVPSFLREIEQQPGMAVRRVISGGELFNAKVLENWDEKVAVYNVYGPTETTVTVTARQVNRQQVHEAGIGKPIGNVRCYVLGAHQQLLPLGATGELCIGGACLSQGYLHQPELTAARFVDDPFRPGEKIYRTGDLVKWLPDGSLEFCGRKDEQVKLRGYRIELGEIEHAIRQYADQVQETVVVVNRSGHQPVLVAYCAVVGDWEEAGLREVLKEKLPAYMIPQQFVVLEQMPLSPSGKVDRTALEQAPLEAAVLEAYVAPETAVEQKMAEIWSELLGYTGVGATDNFFEIGGNSLLIQQVLYRSNKELAAGLTYNDFFRYPTIRALSAIAEKHTVDSNATTVSEEIFLLKKDPNASKQLFFIHDGVGGVEGYADLIRHLEGYQCWGLKSSLFSSLNPHNLELEQVAAAYVERLLEVQAEGPIALIGWSSGGLLAYEMARQLEALERDIDFLILLDTEFPLATRNGEAGDFTLEGEQQLLEQVLPAIGYGDEPPKNLAQLWQSLAAQVGQDGRMSKALGEMVQQELYPGKSDYSLMSVQEQITYVNVIRTIRRMTVRYRPVPIRSAWYFVKAAASQVNADLQQFSAQDVRLLEVPGDHYSMMHWPAVSPVVDLLKSLG